MRTALFSAAFGWVCFGAFAAEPPAANPQADGLVAQLASRSFPEREAATKALFELGPAALPALRKALAENSNAEVQDRAAGLASKIQLASDAMMLTRGKPVAFDFRDRPLNAAVAELRTKLGIPLNLHPGVKDPARLITVKTDELPPWQALEKFCAAVGLTEQLTPDAKPEANPLTGRRPVRQLQPIEIYDGQQMGVQLLGRPGDVVVVLIDGASSPPADRRGGVRVSALPVRYPGSGIDRNTGEITLHLDIAPQQGLNWIATTEIRIGKATAASGQELRAVWKPDGLQRANPNSEIELGFRVYDLETPIPSLRTNPRVLPVIFKTGDGEFKSLRNLEGLILGEIAQPNVPVIVVDDIAGSIGQSFAGPGDSTLTLVSMKIDVKSNSTTLVLRASGANQFAGRQFQRRPAGNAEAVLNFQSFAKIRYTDADGKAMPQPPIQMSSSTSDGIRDTYEVTLRFGSGGGKTATQPAKLVLTGTKMIPVSLPFALKDVPLE